MMLMLAVFSLGAYAQTQQGQSAVGFNIGYGFDSKNATLGVDYRYCITDAVRLSPSLTYFVKNDNHSTWAIDLNAHYVVKLSEMFGFYPLAGLSLSFWNWDAGHGLSHNETRLGANIGLGGEVYATDNLSIGLEVKYNIIKDFDQAMLGVRLDYFSSPKNPRPPRPVRRGGYISTASGSRRYWCSPLTVQAFPLFLHSFTGSYTHTRTYTHTRIINVRIHVCGCV